MIQEYDAQFACDFELLIQDDSKNIKSLFENFEENHRKLLEDAFDYEKKIYDLISSSNITKDELLQIRLDKVVEVNAIVKKDNFGLFDFYFDVNPYAQIIESKFGWYRTNAIRRHDLRNVEGCTTLITQSFIEGIMVNEVPLKNFDLILKDLKVHGNPILGWELLDTILESNPDLSAEETSTLKNKVHDKLLHYLIVFNALDLYKWNPNLEDYKSPKAI